jgi:hypothetical protein
VGESNSNRKAEYTIYRIKFLVITYQLKVEQCLLVYVRLIPLLPLLSLLQKSVKPMMAGEDYDYDVNAATVTLRRNSASMHGGFPL